VPCRSSATSSSTAASSSRILHWQPHSEFAQLLEGDCSYLQLRRYSATRRAIVPLISARLISRRLQRCPYVLAHTLNDRAGGYVRIEIEGTLLPGGCFVVGQAGVTCLNHCGLCLELGWSGPYAAAVLMRLRLVRFGHDEVKGR
jgi:hypothetical protein